jgi:hypothetical protein
MDLEKEEVVRTIYYNLQKIHALWKITEAGVSGRKEEITVYMMHHGDRRDSPSS